MQGWLSRDEKSKLSMFKDTSSFNWKRYHFQQIGNSLAYYKTESAPKQSGTFPIDDIVEIQPIPESPESRFAFKLVNRGKEPIVLQAESADSLKYWISGIIALNPTLNPDKPASDPSAEPSSSTLPGARGRARPISMFGHGTPLPADLQAALATRGRGGPRGGPSSPSRGMPTTPPHEARRGGPPRGGFHEAPEVSAFDSSARGRPNPRARPVSSMADVRDFHASQSPPPKPMKPPTDLFSTPSPESPPVLPPKSPSVEPPLFPSKSSSSFEPPSLPPKMTSPEPPSLPPKVSPAEPPSLPPKMTSPEPPSLPPKVSPASDPPSLPPKVSPASDPPSLPPKVSPASDPPSLPPKVSPASDPPSLPPKVSPAADPPSLPPSLPPKTPIDAPVLPPKVPVELPVLPPKATNLDPPTLPPKADAPSLPAKQPGNPAEQPRLPPKVIPPSLPPKSSLPPKVVPIPDDSHGDIPQPPVMPSKQFNPDTPIQRGIRPPHASVSPSPSSSSSSQETSPTLPPKTGFDGPPQLPLKPALPSKNPDLQDSPRGVPGTPPRLPPKFPSSDAEPPGLGVSRPPGLPPKPSIFGPPRPANSSSESIPGFEQDDEEEDKPLTPEQQQALIQEKRTKIVREILSTEETYIKNLQAMITIYKRIFEEWVDVMEGKSPAAGPSKVANPRSRPLSTVVAKPAQSKFKREHLRTLFSNIQVVVPLNQQLYEEVEGRLKDWSETQKIGDIFVKMAPYFKLYNEYSNNYEAALQLFDRMYTKDVPFVRTLEMAEAEAELVGVLRLENLLILPIQRVPRYNLLIADLLRKTDPGHPDYQNLTEAQEMLEKTAQYLESNITQAENNKRLLQLAAKGAKGLLASHRVLIREGTITVSLGGKPKKFKLRLTLFNDLLVHLSENKSKKKSNMEQQKHQWPLYLVWLKDLVDAQLEEKMLNPKEREKYPYAFELVGPLATYVFWFPDAREKDSWFSSISKATKEEISTRKFMHTLPTEIAEKVSEQDLQAMTPDRPVRVGVYNMLNGGVYQGWWHYGMMHGFGAFSFFGNIYLGEFQHNVKNGKGELHYSTGETYRGTWLHDLPNAAGTLTLPNGDQYDGEWESGKRKGLGTFTSQSGDRYVGDWSEDLPNGNGVLTLSNGTRYEGNWESGQFEKQGVLLMSDGRRYEGDFHRGLRHGQGKFDYTSGSTYEGGWVLGKCSGKGLMITPTWAYEGDFVEDEPHGKGIMEWISGARYEGDWMRGKFHGVGEFTSPVGRIRSYKGEWWQQKMHGKGQITYHNNCTFNGEFEQNIPSGRGIFLFPDRTRLECSWKNGQPDGKASLLADVTKSNKLQTLQGKVTNKVFEPQSGEPTILVSPTTTLPIFQVFL